MSAINTNTTTPVTLAASSLTKAPNSIPSLCETIIPFSGKPLAEDSFYRRVFKTTDEMKTQFVNFLQTIFYQLDETKVVALMDEILLDPTKSDEDIYKELTSRIQETKKSFSFLSQLKALSVVRTGMGAQVGEHMKGLEKSKFENYLEVYNRRYANSIQKEAGLSFKKMVSVCDNVEVTIKDRVEVGSLFSTYPYEASYPLNEATCKDPSLDVDLTFKPIGDEVTNESMDMIACLGGLHHTTVKDRLPAFIQSMYQKLKPGAVLLLRDHNAPTGSDTEALASVVHSFVNASDGTPWEKEAAEIRNFQGAPYWKTLLETQGFIQLNDSKLVLPKDPTENAMMAFVKAPRTKKEVGEAAKYQQNYLRSPAGSSATWLEWGNVRFSKQYAEFIQDHHSYAFDHVGHMRQHWTHFSESWKHARASGASLTELLFSDNMAMNLFILIGTTSLLGVGALSSLPSATIARWRHGEGWRDVANLSALEKFEASFQDKYSKFIDYDPFFKYPYFQTIKDMWAAIWQSDDSFFSKITDSVSAIGSSVTLGTQGIASAFINYVYYSPNAVSTEESIHVLLDDPNDKIGSVIEQWNAMKGSLLVKENGDAPFANCNIKVIYSAEGRKLLSVPYYKPFTEITKLLAKEGITLSKVGGQRKVTLDLLLKGDEVNPKDTKNHKILYEMPKLQDKENKRYVTCEVSISNLAKFCRKYNDQIQYIHAHR